MDFDLKIYIPLIASCITSAVALLVGLFNYRTNIKIKNQQFLINILEKDIGQIIEVQNYIFERLPKLIYLNSRIETNLITLDEIKDIIDMKLSIDYKVLSINTILQESSQSDNFLNIISSFNEESIFNTDLNFVDSIALSKYLNKLSLLLSSLNNEVIIKRINIKNLLV